MYIIQLFIVAIYCICCLSTGSNLEYDFIIVGVGSGGSIMAARLSEPDNNWSVLALDRGSAGDLTQQDQMDNDLSGVHDPNYFSIAQKYLLGRLVRNPRYYGIGGTAIINGMTAVAPSRYLLDQLWPNGWKWDDLFPYMIKMQSHYCYYLPSSLTGISDADCRKWHGQDGPIDIAPPLFARIPELLLDIMKECDEDTGFMTDYDDPTRQYGCYFQQQFRKPSNKSDPNSETIRESTWEAYLNGIVRPNLQILDSATVLKLVFDDNEPTKCVGVTYEYKGQVYTAIAKKEVILSAGVFDTPKILQLSGVGPKQWLEPLGIKVVAENSEVGTNFVDQMALYMAFETTEEMPSLPWGADTCGWLLNSGLKENSMNWTDIQIYCYSRFPIVTLDFPIVGYDPILAYSKPSVPFVTFLVFNALPDANGTVKIQSLSPYDRPQIDHGWQNLSEYDQNNLQFGVNYIRNMTMNTRWGQKYIKRELFPGNRYGGSDDLHRRLNLCSAYHQAGTCGLGKCTDNEARVIGIKNVRVCDVSLFPTQLNVNPTFTLYSMCEKVADLIKIQHSHARSNAADVCNHYHLSFFIFLIASFLYILID
jgi:choline dehydrogenase